MEHTILSRVGLLRTQSETEQDKTLNTSVAKTTSEPTDFVLVTQISQNSMQHFNQHSLSLKVRVVIRSYLHAEQTKTYCIYNVARYTTMADPSRFVIKDSVSL